MGYRTGDWKPCSACRLLRRNSSAVSNVCFAVQRNRVLTSMAIPSQTRQTCLQQVRRVYSKSDVFTVRP